MSKILVAYFSAGGTTEKLAKKLAACTNADLHEIVPKEKYTSADQDWTNNKSRTTIEMNDKHCRPEIVSNVENMAQYEIVFVGFPIWWYREPKIIDSFMEAYDFSGKKVIPFATSGGSPIGSSGINMQKLAPNAKVASGKRIPSGISDAELKQWAGQWVEEIK